MQAPNHHSANSTTSTYLWYLASKLGRLLYSPHARAWKESCEASFRPLSLNPYSLGTAVSDISLPSILPRISELVRLILCRLLPYLWTLNNTQNPSSINVLMIIYPISSLVIGRFRLSTWYLSIRKNRVPLAHRWSCYETPSLSTADLVTPSLTLHLRDETILPFKGWEYSHFGPVDTIP